MSNGKEIVIGHFGSARQVRKAYRQLRRAQLFRPEMEIQVRTPSTDHQDLPLAATDVRGATLRGAAFGAVAGLVGAAFLGAVGPGGIGFSPLLAGLGVLGGLVLGMFAGVLIGPMEPHPALADVEASGTSLLVDSPRESDLQWAAAFFRNIDALVEETPPRPAPNEPPPSRNAHPSYAG